jgi:hypothetical protein
MKIKKSLLLIALGAIMGALSFYLVPYGFELARSGIGVMIGKLEAPQVDFQKSFELHFGGIIGVYDSNQLRNGVNLPTLISLGGSIPVQITISDGKLLVSAEVKNEAGETVAKIHNNEWSVNNNPVIARDRNYNDYAFEVIDSNEVPVLQVYIQSGNLIFVGGLFYYSGGRVLASPNDTILNPTDAEVNEKLTPIFKYPSGGSPYAIPVIVLGVILGASSLVLIPWGFLQMERNKKIVRHRHSLSRRKHN